MGTRLHGDDGGGDAVENPSLDHCCKDCDEDDGGGDDVPGCSDDDADDTAAVHAVVDKRTMQSPCVRMKRKNAEDRARRRRRVLRVGIDAAASDESVRSQKRFLDQLTAVNPTCGKPKRII